MAEKQSGPNIPGNWILWAAIVAIGTYFVGVSEVPIEGSRPSAGSKTPVGVEQLQDVDARLWQDPFAAMWSDIRSKSNNVPIVDCKNSESVKFPHSCPPVERTRDKQTLILGVTLPGAPYTEAEESRRQLRYAVLSSLRTRNYRPADEEHIGYFRQKISEQDENSNSTPLADWGPSWTDVAFEKFIGPEEKREVFVLWINEDELSKATGDRPLRGLADLECALRPQSPAMPLADTVFLGPWSSSTLRTMVGEAANFTPNSKCISLGSPEPGTASATRNNDTVLAIYNSSATIDEDFLRSEFGITKEELPAYFRSHGIDYNRTIATDPNVICAVAGELERRGINPRLKNDDHVVLISEWDSFYGRSLPDSLDTAFGRNECVHETSDRILPSGSRLQISPASEQFHRISYMRGLDGQLADASDRTDTQASRSRTEQALSQDSADQHFTLGPSKNIERPFGNSQYDYLRRLGSNIEQLDHGLRSSGEGRIKAIGVVGSDVYDKLAVLQILRPQFPDVVFFTTDMDARLYHPAELSWTRNLIVASAFGLSLRENLQKDIPPFRTTYQTSAFLATRLILDDEVDAIIGQQKRGPLNWLGTPRLFEIGINEPFAYGLLTKYGYPQTNRDGNECADDLRRSDCLDVVPPLSQLYPLFPALETRPWSFLASALTLGAAIFAFGLCLSTRLKSAVSQSRFGRSPLWQVFLLCFALGALVCLCWPWVANFLTGTGEGEPMYLLSGISLWPSIAIQVIAVVLAGRFLVLGFRKLDTNLCQIEFEFFGLEPPTGADKDDRPAQKGPWLDRLRDLVNYATRLSVHDLMRLFSYRLDWGNSDRTDKRTQIVRFWDAYRSMGRKKARKYRLVIITIAMLLLWFILLVILGNSQPTIRSAGLSRLSFVLSFVEMTVASALIFFVADAAFLCVRFVKGIREFHSEWPKETVDRYAKRLDLSGDYLAHWIDLQFVARRTECINALIYYPFLVLAMLIFSRTNSFDYFPLNWPILIMAALGSSVVFACALALPWMAEKEREAATDDLLNDLIRIRGQGNAAQGASATSPEQIEALMRRINQFHEGAFTPLSQQPVVRALLLPLGGIGGTALLQYFALPGI